MRSQRDTQAQVHVVSEGSSRYRKLRLYASPVRQSFATCACNILLPSQCSRHILERIYRGVVSSAGKKMQKDQQKEPKSQDSSVNIGTMLRDGQPRFDSRLGKGKDFATASRPPREPTQSPIQWIPEIFNEVKRPEREAETHPQKMPMLRTLELYLHSLLYFHGLVLN
jgi:hypothetical protein